MSLNINTPPNKKRSRDEESQEEPSKRIKKENSNKIQALDKSSIKKICSGQVITSLPSMIKELIENCIDANATTIEITFKDYGLECVTVADNGIGLDEENYKNICKPHHTSKIRTMEDISLLETLGFRGEALGSLATLSEISIVTKTKNQKIGNELKFEGNELISQNPISREVGMTIIVKSLFKNLPVRFKELQKNIKKEFPKVMTLIEQYALINDKIRFIVKNITQGKK
jgi:DNA mismatch repair protein PMS2